MVLVERTLSDLSYDGHQDTCTYIVNSNAIEVVAGLSKNGGITILPLSEKLKHVTSDMRQNYYVPTIVAAQSHECFIDDERDEEEEKRMYEREDRPMETTLYDFDKSLLETLDTAVLMLIKELMTGNFSFYWYPKQGEESSLSNSSSVSFHRVTAWFEMGYDMKKSLVQPKFFWRINENDDNLNYGPSTSTSSQMKVKSSICRPESQSIELLNIVRIVVPTEIDLQIQPFVKKECAFSITTVGTSTYAEEEYVFQAASQDERDRFVVAFKIMVARLTSKIIVGDKRVFDEFFTRPVGEHLLLTSSCLQDLATMSSLEEEEEETPSDLYYDSHFDTCVYIFGSSAIEVVAGLSKNGEITILPLSRESKPLTGDLRQNHVPTIVAAQSNEYDFDEEEQEEEKRVYEREDRPMEMKWYEYDKSLFETLDVKVFDISHSAAVLILTKELMTSNFSFYWHPKQGEESWSDSSSAPFHRVKAWFEMGYSMKKSFLQPKFVWRLNENDDNLNYGSSTSTSCQMKIKNMICKPESIDLLNIVRIAVPNEIDRQLYPFVKRECALIIGINTGEEYVFQVVSQDERDRFVLAFKIMVARLVSKIIVGDKRVFDEFFTRPVGVEKMMTLKRRRMIY